MKYQHVLAAFYAEPWAILPWKLLEIQSLLHFKADGGLLSDEEIQRIVAARRPNIGKMAGRVAVMPVMGTILQRCSAMEQSSGAVSAEMLGAELDKLAMDASVKCCLMVYDSPGGSVLGLETLAEKMRAFQSKKPLYAHASSMAASAAYWLATQASKLSIEPGGSVGSIGVLAIHQDYQGYLEQSGVRTTMVYQGKMKTAGNPYEMLSEDAKKDMEEKVADYYGRFVGAVAKGRGVSQAKVRDEFGQGTMVNDKEAVRRGMADEVATLDNLLARLRGGNDPTNPVYQGDGDNEQPPQTDGNGAPSSEVDGPPLSARLASYRAAAIAADAGLVIAAFTHNSKTADKEPAWGSVDKAALPRLAFADMGDEGKKSSWSYPHHWVQNASGKDDDGVWTEGTLLLHKQGLNAAWSAAQGGRSGKKASAEVIAHLQAHRKAIGLDDDGDDDGD
jgi:signal peptide peptidase SppA